MDATDIYGLSEVIGPGVAQECVETKDGLHIWEDHFYPEVIDPETGAVLPDGEKGELVFTSLTKEAFPIIRYRTRDLTRLLPGTARPGMRRMEKVTGRSDDMIILRGVNVFPTQIEEVLLATDWCGGHFIIELTREGRMDEMTVRGGSAAGALGRQRAGRAHRAGHRLHQEHHRHHRARSARWRRKRWSARSARPNASTTSDRRNRHHHRDRESSMTSNPSRRDILTSSIAVAAGAALPSLGQVSPAMANPSLDVRRRDRRRHQGQEDDGRRRRQGRVRARRAGQGSQRADHREQGPGAGGGGGNRRGRTGPAAARRPSHRRQGQHQHRRHADIRRHAGAAEGAARPQRAVAAEAARRPASS